MYNFVLYSSYTQSKLNSEFEKKINEVSKRILRNISVAENSNFDRGCGLDPSGSNFNDLAFTGSPYLLVINVYAYIFESSFS